MGWHKKGVRQSLLLCQEDVPEEGCKVQEGRVGWHKREWHKKATRMRVDVVPRDLLCQGELTEDEAFMPRSCEAKVVA